MLVLLFSLYGYVCSNMHNPKTTEGRSLHCKLKVCEHLLHYAIGEVRTKVNTLLPILKYFSETLLYPFIPQSSFLFVYFLTFDTNICMIQDPFSLGVEPNISNIGLCCLTVSYLVHMCLFIFVRRIQPLTRILSDGVGKKMKYN